MEDNVADALKMAGSVLLFVIGLSIAFLTFSQARETIDIVLSYSDRESLTVEGDERFYYLSNNNDTNRYVGKETIIPAIYRAYKENYKIVFEFNDGYYLFEDSNGQQVSTIDLEKQSIASDLASRRFLDGIIYRKFDNDSTELEVENEDDFKEEFKIKPNSLVLYEYLTSKEGSGIKIKESLGTYYIQDINGTSEIEEVSKTEKRVITYTFE